MLGEKHIKTCAHAHDRMENVGPYACTMPSELLFAEGKKKVEKEEEETTTT